MNEYELAKQGGWQCFLGELPVEHQFLVAFWEELKKKMPELICVPDDSHTIRHPAPNDPSVYIRVHRRVAIAHSKMPNEKLGAIAYDKYDDKYEVWSRLIANERFSRWNSEHRSQRSKHMNKMLKVAQKVLLPMQVHEMWEKSKDDFLRHLGRIRDNANEGMRSHVNTIAMDTWRTELLHMVGIGYKPVSPMVKRAMEYVVDSKESYERDSGYNPAKAFIWLKPDGVVYQRFGKGTTLDDVNPIEVPSTDDLPEEMKGKLFVLSVCDNRKFVEDVGMKEADDKFWVIL